MGINKIVFMGTPDFAVPCLEIVNKHYQVVGVITQPDKPKGRGQKLQMSPVKEYALKENLPVFQPVKVRDEEFIKQLALLEPDLIVVVAFGQILPEAILNMPKYGCINVHGSLLPRWRGAAPIHWSIIAGDHETGVTTMHMAKGLDTGDMILKATIPISENMTTAELHDIMMEVGANTLLETIRLLSEGSALRLVQDDNLSTYAVMLNNDNTKIDWHKSAEEVHNLVRGLNSWPVAYTEFNGKKYKLWQTEVVDYQGEPGKILNCDKSGIVVACGNRAIKILVIQPPNKGKMDAGSYVNGHKQELESIGYFK